MRTVRSAAFLGPLVLALSSTTALASTTINSSTTTPLQTSSAGDITIDNAGTLTVSGVPAITVDSSNNVTLNTTGTIVSSNSNNSGGILVNPGVTTTIVNGGPISALENYTAPLLANTTDIAGGPIANTTGRYGILVNGAGSGSITNNGTIKVKGLAATGIAVSGAYSGTITNAGAISVIGDYGIGVSTQSVSGQLAVGGTVSVVGQGAQAVVANGDIGGQVTLYGSLSQASSYTTDSSTTQSLAPSVLQTGKATVEIDGNVLGGILLYAPCSATTVNNVASCTSSNPTTSTTAISSVGTSPGLQIGGANNITIAAGAASINGNSYSLVVDGSVTAADAISGTNTSAVVIGGRGGNVAMPGGIGITGGVSATANDGTATGILINPGSTVPLLTNSGAISATLTQAGGVAAYGVRDLSGTLTTINNSGSIGASNAVNSTAIDLSANTSGVTITQALNPYETQEQIQEQAASGYTAATAKVYTSIAGDIATGSGNDLIAIQSGTVNGNAYLGGGNDTVALSNDAKWTGNLNFGAGTGSVTLANTSSFTGALNAADMPTTVVIGDTASFAATGISGGSRTDVTVNGGSFGGGAGTTLAIRSLTVNSGGTFTAYIDGVNGVSSLVQAGTATFASGAKVAATVSSLTNAAGTYQILSAGTLAGNPSFDASTTDLPVLFKGSVTEQGNSLYLSIARKTAADLGLTSSQTAGYDAIYADALVNASLADSLLQVADVPTLQGQMNALLPDHAGGTFAFVSQADRLVTRHLSDASSIYDISDVGGWLEPVYFRGSKDETGTAPYKFDGYGVSAGLERKALGGRVGISLAWISGSINDGSWDNIGANDYQLGAFWRMNRGPLYAFAKLSGDRVSFNSTRTFTGEVSSAALTYVANGHWAGWAISGAGGVSYNIPLNANFNLKPMVEVDYTRLRENSYAETGASEILLGVNGRTSDSLTAVTTLTAGWSMGEVTRDERPLTFELEGGRRNQVSGNLGATTASFSGGNPFTITPDDLKGGWLGEARMLFGGMDYTWQVTARADELQGNTDLSARVSLSLAL